MDNQKKMDADSGNDKFHSVEMAKLYREMQSAVPVVAQDFPLGRKRLHDMISELQSPAQRNFNRLYMFQEEILTDLSLELMTYIE